MKRVLVLLCAGILAAGFAGCGGGEGDPSQAQGDGTAEENDPSAEIPEAPAEGSSDGEGEASEDGWSQDMEAVKTAVVDLLGDDYWPDMAIEPDVLESMTGISSDMYEDYFGEMPMINIHVDTLIVIKAKEEQADAVEQALLDYHEASVSDTLQYPMNVGKIQAARVERIGNYVIFARLGADTADVSETGDEDEVIAHCREINDLVIEVISNKLRH